MVCSIKVGIYQTKFIITGTLQLKTSCFPHVCMKKIKQYKVIETLKAQAFFITLKLTLCMMTCEADCFEIIDVADGFYQSKPNFFIRYKDKIYYPKINLPF